MDNTRWPGIGDLLIERKKNGDEFIGLVTSIDKNGNVFIDWVKKNPNYTEKWGYSATNIHNDFSAYEIIKNANR
jgi:small nuclear ribonucleoprotein (snRNP)-like protein